MKQMKGTIHLPGLNGLRAIAALSVMWGHVFQSTFGDWGFVGFALPVVDDGVTLFFVISGFLITYLLLHEKEKTQDVCVSKFYIRRVLRIWPIYYLYLVIALSVTGLWSQSWLECYLFFAANIPFVVSLGIWPIVHYWSIGVEEQFYLFWPWFVKKAGSVGRLLRWAFLLFLVWLVCKYGTYLIFGKCLAYRFFAVTRFDCMMIGAMGAMLYDGKNTLFLKLTGNRVVGLICLLLLMFSRPWAGFLSAPVRSQCIALLSLMAVMSQLTQKPLLNLENKWCDSIGKISYGIYVIHPLLIFLLSKCYLHWEIRMGSIVDTIVVYGLVTLVTYLLAFLSYRFFETPFLKLKDRYAIVRSRNSIKELI